MNHSNRVIFFIPKGVHLLDLAGAVQTFYEAGDYDEPYQIIYVSDTPAPVCSAGLPFGRLLHYSKVQPGPNDLLIIPGFDIRLAATLRNDRVHSWLRKASQHQATICSVCTAAFLLAEAGLLHNRECTTHWKYTQRLQKQHPQAKVLTDRLFVKSGNIYTSAGVTTGLDMALFLLEERHGPDFAYKIARELVVYIRRDGSETQQSVYMQYRAHVNNAVHTVQNWMIRNLTKKFTIEELATLAHTSPRNLTRLFKSATGITIGQYIEKLRVEKAIQLLGRQAKVDAITRQCGLQSANQLRHLLRKHTGRLPSQLTR